MVMSNWMSGRQKARMEEGLLQAWAGDREADRGLRDEGEVRHAVPFCCCNLDL